MNYKGFFVIVYFYFHFPKENAFKTDFSEHIHAFINFFYLFLLNNRFFSYTNF